MDDRPSSGAELRLLEHLRRAAPHPAIREPRPIALERLAAEAGLDPAACRAALHGLEASGRIALRVHDDGLLEARSLSGLPDDEAPIRRFR